MARATISVGYDSETGGRGWLASRLLGMVMLGLRGPDQISCWRPS